MPFFTLQIDSNGPMLNAVVGVSDARSAAMIAEGEQPPDPIVLRGLVDTGASCTCVDPVHVEKLGIPPTGSTTLMTPSTGKNPVTVDQYDVSLAIYSSVVQSPCRIQNLPIVPAELKEKQGFDILIGRDVLSRCVLIYNGFSGVYTLAF